MPILHCVGPTVELSIIVHHERGAYMAALAVESCKRTTCQVSLNGGFIPVEWVTNHVDGQIEEITEEVGNVLESSRGACERLPEGAPLLDGIVPVLQVDAAANGIREAGNISNRVDVWI